MIISPKDKYPDSDFLPHLSDPFRRQIAVWHIQHDMRKLLPAVRNQETWKTIDVQIAGWYDALSIRNFWNAVHGISMGFHLTNFISWITSLHIQWKEDDIKIEDLWFGSRRLADTLKVEESATNIRNAIFLPENSAILDEERIKNAEIMGSTAPRDQFPKFVIRKDENHLRVVDGNTRLLYAILNEKPTIRAVVGEPVAEPLFSEHWVPTSLMVDLAFWHEQQALQDRDTTAPTAQVISELIKDSRAGQREFRERGVHLDNEYHWRLLEEVDSYLT